MVLSDVEEAVDRFGDLGPDELQRLWVTYFEVPAPKQISRQVMLGAIAYRLQERVLGGLQTKTKRQLDDLARNQEVKRLRRDRTRYRIKPGTRLLREWQGRTYEVIAVSDRCFLFDGKRYRSLSEIARVITGTQWSGPRFFGLKQALKHG